MKKNILMFILGLIIGIIAITVYLNKGISEYTVSLAKSMSENEVYHAYHNSLDAYYNESPEVAIWSINKYDLIRTCTSYCIDYFSHYFTIIFSHFFHSFIICIFKSMM